MAKAATTPESTISNAQYIRETVESIIVAFILAFLFRAFVAEAFVIPTGSMAPTLMGAHKDITCIESGERFQVGASEEFNNDTGERSGNYVVGSTSSLSRAVNPIDFEDPNHATFSGDRILVSKFDYILSSPKRWDVIVFKFPEHARQNFIKRLVGLPNEELMVFEGDIFVRRSESEAWSIARKPPHKFLAMRQPVSDTNHLSTNLVSLGYPSLWQNWSSEGAVGWNVEQNTQGWSAQLQTNNSPAWLRYYHKTLTEREWLEVERDKRLPTTSAQDSSLVTDYLAYNSYNESHGAVQMDVESLVTKFPPTDNGMHWVGDLCAEFDFEIQSDSGQLMLQAFEFGIEFRLTIDVQNGQAKLQAFDATQAGKPLIDGIFSGQPDVIAATKIRGKGSYKVAMANVDEQILVWINGSLVKFNQPAEYDSQALRQGPARRPYWSQQDPMDAAPLGIGGSGLAMKVTQAKVYRDIYYISCSGNPYHDFDNKLMLARSKAAPASDLAQMNDQRYIAFIYSNPKTWEETPLFGLRQAHSFSLGDKQYFPMGDNSARSLDARMWREHFVEERFLLGKALLVFWPHPWNAPIPFLPNISRMGLIR